MTTAHRSHRKCIDSDVVVSPNGALGKSLPDTSGHNERRTGVPALAPASHCASEESSDVEPVAGACAGEVRDIRGRYRVDPRVLGMGRQGSVRGCVDRATGERLAVKTMLKRHPAIERAGFAREIQLLHEMDHPGIVRLVDAHEDGDYLHIVTELCEGGELYERIVERSSSGADGAACFAEGEAARMLHQILTAVSHMHQRGVVHRDIKPENILFKTKHSNSPIKIIDFGLARRHQAEKEPPMSSVVGTPYYIAPEVLRKKYDRSCDLWSVGVTAYILLCGYPPFNGHDRDEVYDAVRRGCYSFPTSGWSGTSGEARDFVRRLLRRNPKKRMTAEQALVHPWIARHVGGLAGTRDEKREDNESVEVVFQASSRDSIICDGIEKRIRIPLVADL